MCGMDKGIDEIIGCKFTTAEAGRWVYRSSLFESTYS